MKKAKEILMELILVFSAVLVFRSLWTMMDMVPLLQETYMHIILLVLGIFLTAYALDVMTKKKWWER